MIYLMMHSTHSIYRKETRCRHIGYSYQLTSRVLLYAPSHRQAFVIPVMEHWLEREIAQWVHPMKDRSHDPSHHERTLWATSRSYSYMVSDIWLSTTENNNRENLQLLLNQPLFLSKEWMNDLLDMIVQTMAFSTPVVEPWVKWGRA